MFAAGGKRKEKGKDKSVCVRDDVTSCSNSASAFVSACDSFSKAGGAGVEGGGGLGLAGAAVAESRNDVSTRAAIAWGENTF